MIKIIRFSKEHTHTSLNKIYQQSAIKYVMLFSSDSGYQIVFTRKKSFAFVEYEDGHID